MASASRACGRRTSTSSPVTSTCTRVDEVHVPDEHEQLAGEYEAFIEANVDRLSTWVEYDGLSPDEVLKRRKFYEQFDEDCVRPVWRSGTINLESLAEMYPQVLIAEVADGIPGLLRTLSRKYGTLIIRTFPRPGVQVPG